MTSSTSSSDPPREESRARAALCWSLGLWLVVELVLAASLPTHLGRHEVDDRVAAIEQVGTCPEVVLLSDSVTYGALDTIGWKSPEVLDLSTNQAIGVPGNVFLLRRLGARLDSRKRYPEVQRVVYVVRPTSLSHDPSRGRFVDSYFTSVFNRPREVRSMRLEFEDSELADAMESAADAQRFEPPSLRRRGHLLRPLSLWLRSLGQELDSGAPLPPLTASAREQLAQESAWTEPRFSEATRRGLPLLAAEARALGAELEIRFAPVAPSLAAAWSENGYGSAVVEELRSLLGDSARVYARPLYEARADEVFSDGSHLAIDPRREYAEELAGYLTELAGKAD